MGTLSAEIVIGTGHPNDGGLIRDSIQERIQILEGDRVALFVDGSSSKLDREYRLTFPHSIQNVGNSLCILIWFIMTSKSDSNLSIHKFKKLHSLYFGHLENFTNSELDRFYAEASIWSVSQQYKIIVSIYEDSVLGGQIDAFERFGLDFEFLRPFHSRLYSPWTKGHIVRKTTDFAQNIDKATDA